MVQLTQSYLSSKKQSPKTVLGFYSIILGIWVSASVIVIGFLARTRTTTWLIPWVGGQALFFLLLVFVGVFIVSLKDPSKLMLTQVTGSEFVEIQRGMYLGDSVSGLQFVTSRELQGLPTSVTDSKVIEVGAINEEGAQLD